MAEVFSVVSETGAVPVGGELFRSLLYRGSIRHGKARGDVQAGGRFQRECAGARAGGIAAVKQRDGSKLHPPILEPRHVHDGGEIDGSVKSQVETRQKHAVKDGNNPFVCSKDMFKKHLRGIRCLSKGDNSRGEKLRFAQFVGVENVERTDHIRNFVAGELVVAEISCAAMRHSRVQAPGSSFCYSAPRAAER